MRFIIYIKISLISILFAQGISAQPDFFCLQNIGTSTQNSLNWNNPTACGAADSILVFFGTQAAGPYTQIAGFRLNENIETFVHDYGSDLDQFYFIQQVGQDCSPTNINSDTLTNRIPNAPRLSNLSLDNNGFANFTWEPSNSTGVLSYEIRRQVIGDNSTVEILDTVLATEALAYFDNTINHLSQNENFGYNIKPINCSGGGDIQSLANPFRLVVANVGSDPCAPASQIAWGSAGGPFQVSGYRILQSINDGAFEVVANQTTTEQTYDFTFSQTGTYQFRIEILDENQELIGQTNTIQLNSTSNEQNFLDAFSWSISGNDNLIFSIVFSGLANFKSLELYNGSSPDALSAVKTFNIADGITSEDLIYEDVNTTEQQFFELRAVDICDQAVNSGVFATGFIQQTIEGNERTVSWALPSGNDSLQLNNVRILKTIGSDTTLFLENPTSQQQIELLGEAEFGNTVCYFIESIGTYNDFTGEQRTFVSRSNTSCLTQEAAYFFPNAFSPNGINNTFLPKTRRQNHDGYKLQVFDRYGRQIFESTSFENGWNGFIENRLASPGVYAYQLQFLNLETGATDSQQGIVTVVY